MTESENLSPHFCSECGSSLRPGARFCPACGQTVLPRLELPVEMPPEVPQGANETFYHETIQPTDPENVQIEPLADTTHPLQEIQAEPAGEPVQSPEGYRLTLENVPLQARGRVILGLRQSLNLTPAQASAYVISAPVLLAVGLPEDMAVTLRNALTNAGAEVSLEAPQPPSSPVKSIEPSPEPVRRISSASETIHRADLKRGGLRTVIGLDIGGTNAYLAFARASATRLAAAPEMIQFDSSSMVPVAVVRSPKGQTGRSAMQAWIQDPEGAVVDILSQVGEDDTVLPYLGAFLEGMACRVVEVLGSSALALADGASTILGVPTGWDRGRVERLVSTATMAGFPISAIVPYPIAVLNHHLHTGLLHLNEAKEKCMVIDWGGSCLAISFLEYGQELERPVVFEHIEYPLGGKIFDEKLLTLVLEQLPQNLTNEDRRALLVYTRQLKQQMSAAFAEGKTIYSQYCIFPPEAPPTRLRLERAAFENGIGEEMEQIRIGLEQAVGQVGLKPEHLNHILLAGGGANWYFSRGLIRETLEQVPLVGAHPEESIARGLAVNRLDGQL